MDLIQLAGMGGIGAVIYALVVIRKINKDNNKAHSDNSKAQIEQQKILVEHISKSTEALTLLRAVIEKFFYAIKQNNK